MNAILILVLLIFAGCQSKPIVESHTISSIDYVIEPTTYDGSPSLAVTLRFLANPSGKTTLVLPQAWASENDYYKDVRDLRVITSGAKITDTDPPFLRTIISSANQPLTISYILVAGKSRGGNPYRALITSEYFHIVGYNLFAFPDVSQKQKLAISLTWRGFSKNYSFANSFGSESTHQTLMATIEDLKGSIYVGGDFQIHKEMIRNRPVFVAIRGQWLFSKKELFAQLRKIIETQRQFFNDDEFPYFLVTVIPNGLPCCTTGGTGLHNSFATFLPQDQKIDPSLLWLYAHELFHTWNGSKIPLPQKQSELSYWFSEGFTSYYARLLNLRSGLISLQEYADDYNRVLYRYAFSGAVNVPNSAIEKGFWTDPDIGKIPYYRGDILAHRWNLLLKMRTPPISVDLPLIDLFKQQSANATPISGESWIRIMLKYADIQKDLADYVNAGQSIPIEPGALGPCVSLETRDLGKPEYGYDVNATKKNQRITGLLKDSEAYRAGLREGQRVLETNMVNPPLRPSGLKISDDKGVRWIKFVATGKQRRPVPLYVLDLAKFKKNPALCMSWFQNSGL